MEQILLIFLSRWAKYCRLIESSIWRKGRSFWYDSHNSSPIQEYETCDVDNADNEDRRLDPAADCISREMTNPKVHQINIFNKTFFSAAYGH